MKPKRTITTRNKIDKSGRQKRRRKRRRQIDLKIERRKKAEQARKRRLQEQHRRIADRLDKTKNVLSFQPVFSTPKIHYQVAEKTKALRYGGIGVIGMLVCKLALAAAINSRLFLLRLHLPYHESDHVLNIAYNALCGGKNLEHLENLRTDENYLNALGACRIPDPTTAGDFCRRFQKKDIYALMDVIDEARLKIWKLQPEAFFDEAWIDADGVFVETSGKCKQGIEYNKHKKAWGYHPLVISLAQTQEVFSIVNRKGARPSHEGAPQELDRAILLCRQAGFRKILLRGDTDFSQTKYLDGWAQEGVYFVFGIDAMKNLVELAESLPESAFQQRKPPKRAAGKSRRRARPENVKERIVQEKGWKNVHLEKECIAECSYRPVACKRDYRLIILRKHLRVEEKGETRQEIRYFYYLTNDDRSAEQMVRLAHQRCDQENLNAHLQGDVCALRAPLKCLLSNWAYMVMTSLAWTLKCWAALTLPDEGESFFAEQGDQVAEGAEEESEAASTCGQQACGPPQVVARRSVGEEKRRVLRMEFSTFVTGFMHLPCQIVRSGRRLIFRLLSWNRSVHIFLRLVDRLQTLRC